MEKKIFSKHGSVSTRIARNIMAMNPGDRMPTIIELTERFSVSRGIVQNAINFLEEEGCIELSRSGKLGTELVSIDYAALYSFTNWDPVVGAMPVPYNNTFRSLASAIYSASQEFPFDSSIVYANGALNRLSMLRKNFFDYIVTSVATARYVTERDKNIGLLFELPGCQYEIPYCLMFTQEGYTEITDGMRVGVDPETVDQMELTKALCAGKDVELVSMPFETTVEMLHDKKIDCSVIRQEPWLEKNLHMVPLPIPETAYPASDTTTPAVIFNRSNYGIEDLLRRFLIPERIAEAQMRALKIHSSYKF